MVTNQDQAGIRWEAPRRHESTIPSTKREDTVAAPHRFQDFHNAARVVHHVHALKHLQASGDTAVSTPALQPRWTATLPSNERRVRLRLRLRLDRRKTTLLANERSVRLRLRLNKNELRKTQDAVRKRVTRSARSFNPNPNPDRSARMQLKSKILVTLLANE